MTDYREVEAMGTAQPQPMTIVPIRDKQCLVMPMGDGNTIHQWQLMDAKAFDSIADAMNYITAVYGNFYDDLAEREKRSRQAFNEVLDTHMPVRTSVTTAPYTTQKIIAP